MVPILFHAVVSALRVQYKLTATCARGSFIPWCWSVTGRSLVRDYATKRYWGTHDEALASREMAESVLGFHLLCAEKKIPIARELMCPPFYEFLGTPHPLVMIAAGASADDIYDWCACPEVMADTLKGYLDNPETLLPIDISVRVLDSALPSVHSILTPTFLRHATDRTIASSKSLSHVRLAVCFRLCFLRLFRLDFFRPLRTTHASTRFSCSPLYFIPVATSNYLFVLLFTTRPIASCQIECLRTDPRARWQREMSGKPASALYKWQSGVACIHKQEDKLSEGKRGRVWAPPVTAEIGDELEARRGAERDASGGLAVERTNVLEPLFFSSPRL